MVFLVLCILLLGYILKKILQNKTNCTTFQATSYFVSLVFVAIKNDAKYEEKKIHIDTYFFYVHKTTNKASTRTNTNATPINFIAKTKIKKSTRKVIKPTIKLVLILKNGSKETFK